MTAKVEWYDSQGRVIVDRWIHQTEQRPLLSQIIERRAIGNSGDRSLINLWLYVLPADSVILWLSERRWWGYGRTLRIGDLAIGERRHFWVKRYAFRYGLQGAELRVEERV